LGTIDNRSGRTNPVVFVPLGGGNVLWAARVNEVGQVRECSADLRDVDALSVDTAAPGNDFGSHAV
jgi:hypothetical protein